MSTPGHSFIRAVSLNRDAVPSFKTYPFNLPCIAGLQRLELHPAVTFFVGENGSGKSTLLEAIAVKLDFNAEGGDRNLRFASHDTHSPLHEHLRLERTFGARPTDGCFLRAESFYNVATELEKLEKEYPSRSGPFSAYGGKSLHAQSHGESFLAFLMHRPRGYGVYIFDEPEAALSPHRQMAVLVQLHRLVQECSQLIIATHSPILLAYPQAWIYQFSESGIARVNYTDTEHYRVTKDFLNRHERMLHILLTDEEDDLKKTER